MRAWRAPALCIVAASLALFGCKVSVRSGLSEVEANQIVVALDRAAVVAHKRAVTGGGEPSYQVDVATADAIRALRVLDAQRLPKAVQPGFEELYGNTGLVATPGEERVRLAAATAGELSRSLERMPGVLDARVHLALPEPSSALDAKPTPITAAVLLQTARAHQQPFDEEPVRKLVASAVKGLDAGRVSIVRVNAESPAVAAPAFVRVGPFTVTRDSAAGLRAALGAALVLDLVLAVALIAAVRRLWRVQAPNVPARPSTARISQL
jgi:type III secretion protein J